MVVSGNRGRLLHSKRVEQKRQSAEGDCNIGCAADFCYECILFVPGKRKQDSKEVDQQQNSAQRPYFPHQDCFVAEDRRHEKDAEKQVSVDFLVAGVVEMHGDDNPEQPVGSKDGPDVNSCFRRHPDIEQVEAGSGEKLGSTAEIKGDMGKIPSQLCMISILVKPESQLLKAEHPDSDDKSK